MISAGFSVPFICRTNRRQGVEIHGSLHDSRPFVSVDGHAVGIVACRDGDSTILLVPFVSKWEIESCSLNTPVPRRFHLFNIRFIRSLLRPSCPCDRLHKLRPVNTVCGYSIKLWERVCTENRLEMPTNVEIQSTVCRVPDIIMVHRCNFYYPTR